MPATRVEASVASAPIPASSPDHISRFTKGLSVIAADSIRLRPLANSYLSSPPQIVSTISVFARSSCSSLTSTLSKIQPLSTCSIDP